MNIHPTLRALREDDAPLRDAQEAMARSIARWRERSEVAGVLAQLETFAAGAPMDECPALAALFQESDCAARELAFGFVAETVAALDKMPLGHVALRHFTDGVLSTLLLARLGNVTLTLVAVDGERQREKPAPVTVDFGPSEIWGRVLSGTARAELVERTSCDEKQAALDRRILPLRPGAVVFRDAERHALLLREVEGCLVSLRLQRRRPMAGATREYRLDDGRHVHQAAGNPRDSRLELMMALLGRMERTDAVPLLAELAREDGSAALRWQAVRECLALDTLTGFRTLCAIAASPRDALAPAAGTLRSRLVETYPQLAEIDPSPT